MKLTHYSAKPLGRLRDTDQKTHDSFKPTGLWVSVDEGGQGWLDWCRDNEFHLAQCVVQQEIILKDDLLTKYNRQRKGGILHIDNEADLILFGDEYSDAIYKGGRRDWVVWTTVAEHYDGLIIAPYIWSMRLNLIWYYGWDCASGCLWRPTKTVSRVGAALPVEPKEETDDAA